MVVCRNDRCRRQKLRSYDSQHACSRIEFQNSESRSIRIVAEECGKVSAESFCQNDGAGPALESNARVVRARQRSVVKLDLYIT